MDYPLDAIKTEERVTLELRRLYERRGYRKFRAGRFEEYRLYLENQAFLDSEQVITFTDLDGRLLALKPDVTLSIVKNARVEGGTTEKFYYTEKVFRAGRETHAFREISQMGLELMGRVDGYAKAEVVSLARESLAAVGRNHLLEISHMGFMEGLLDSLQVPEAVREGMLGCIRGKNAPELRRLALAAGLPEADGELLCSLTTLYGPYLPTLERAARLARGRVMQRAVDELRELYEALEVEGDTACLQLDFSMINNLSYYNGVIFQGYVQNLPRSVLAGGQYDRLMEKLGKGCSAMGFALYLDELSRLQDARPAYDLEVLIEYSPGLPAAQVARTVGRFLGQGLKVQACARPAPHLRCKRKFLLDSKGLREVGGVTAC